jgi:Putative restriction endonuclease
MKAAEALQAPVRGAEVWPLSVEAYHVLGEARLIPERTELLYGSVYHKKRSKLRAYASAGVKECWLVLGRERQIEVHRQPGDGHFAERSLHGPGGRLTSAAIPSLTVDVSIYQSVG